MKVLNWLSNFFLLSYSNWLLIVVEIVLILILFSVKLKYCNDPVVPVDADKPKIEVVQKPPVIPNDKILIVRPDGTETKKKVDTPKPDLVISVPTSDSTYVDVGVKKSNPFFPDFINSPWYDVTVIDGDSTKVAVAHQSNPVFDFSPDIQVGVGRSLNNTYLSVASTPIKIGPVYVGPSINTDFNTVRIGADGVIKLKENIVLGVSLDPFDLKNPSAVVRVKF